MKILSIIVLLNLIYLIKCNKNSEQIVIAHRGASGYLPEHTLEAKVAAFFMRADYIEQDVVLTKDNVPIVLHDYHLDEVSNVAKIFPGRQRIDKRYYAIDFTIDEIKKLEVTERFYWNNPEQSYFPSRFPKWKSTFRINTLQEEIELIQSLEKSFKPSKKVGIYVEIKNPEFHANEKKANFSEIVLEILAKYGYNTKQDKAIIQCFDPKELKRIRNDLKSNLTLVQLLEDNQVMDGFDWTSFQGLNEIKMFADGIGPEKDQLIVVDSKSKEIKPSEFYQNAKKLGLFMHPYTFRSDKLPDYAKSYNELLTIFFDKLKVNGVFTDFPDTTVEFLKSTSHKFFPNFWLFSVLILTSAALFV